MEQRNENIFHINYKNQMYVLSTSLIGNKIKLVCRDYLTQTFDGEFALEDLYRLSRYFQPTHSIEQIQGYLNGIIGKQRVGFVQNGDALSIVLYLINKDIISIPLIRKEINSYGYNNYTNYNIEQNIQTSNQINTGNIIYNSGNTNILQDNSQNINDILKLIQNQNSNQQQQIFTRVAQGIEKTAPKGAQIQKAEPSSQVNYDEKKFSKLEDDTNTIKVEQEKLKKDMKRLIEEASKLKEENMVYKTDHDSLTQENAQLKESNNNYQMQVKELQEENNNLKNQIVLLNKDVDAFESQNNEIRKMYAELENDNNMYKNQVDELNKENEELRGQVEELNNNFTQINNELENIKNENNKFKDTLEQQKDNMNEDLINKLEEENKLYKQKAEENELLKKQIEELQYQLQIGQERQIEEGEEGEEGKEVKGDIIHDIKELEMITKRINKDEDKKIIINLLYKASVDSDKASAFHEKCDQAQNTIVLVETKKGKRFGGYTTCSWSGNCVDKNDPEAFIFSFDKMKTYDNIPGDEAIGCYPKFGPIFLGCQIKIFDNAFTKGGTTFEKELNFYTEEDYELTGGDRVFDVKDIEVYEVIIE